VRRLQFVARFAQLDLRRLRQGDWLNLREDVAWFLSGVWYGPDFDFGRDAIPTAHGDIMAHPDNGPTPQGLSQAEFFQLQADTRALLADLLEAPGTRSISAAPLPIQARLRVVETQPEQKALVAAGTTHDLFLLLIYMLLWQEQRLALARCPACGTIFYKNRNQEYCSRACTNRVSQRLWQARHAAASVK
jgi:hypothetical protein